LVNRIVGPDIVQEVLVSLALDRGFQPHSLFLPHLQGRVVNNLLCRAGCVLILLLAFSARAKIG